MALGSSGTTKTMTNSYPASTSIYIDTNCINARQSNQDLNALEQLNEDGKIIIEKTDVLDTELKEGLAYPRGQKKSLGYIESYGPFVLGHSRLGFSVLGTKVEESEFAEMLELLWGKKGQNLYTKNEVRDAMHIYTASRYGGTFFVTSEEAILAKANAIEKRFGIKVRDPNSCLIEVEERLKKGY